MVESWRNRAIMLNDRPVPGEFCHIPPEFDRDLIANVLRAMSLDWERTVVSLKNAITKPNKRGYCSKTVTFGKERIAIMSQSYRSTFLNLLLRYSLFGVNESNLTKDEVIYKTNLVTVVNIASLDRINKIFTLTGQCGVTFYKVNGYKYSCCGKINCMVDGKNMIRYILEQRQNKWCVKLASNKLVEVNQLYWDKSTTGYQYAGDSRRRSRRTLVVTQYWTIRFQIHHSGTFKFTFNRLTLDANNKIIPQLSS